MIPLKYLDFSPAANYSDFYLRFFVFYYAVYSGIEWHWELILGVFRFLFVWGLKEEKFIFIWIDLLMRKFIMKASIEPLTLDLMMIPNYAICFLIYTNGDKIFIFLKCIAHISLQHLWWNSIDRIRIELELESFNFQEVLISKYHLIL